MECVGPPLLPNLSGDQQPLPSFCQSPIKTLEKESEQLFSLLGTPSNSLNLPSVSHFSIIIAKEACFPLGTYEVLSELRATVPLISDDSEGPVLYLRSWGHVSLTWP